MTDDLSDSLLRLTGLARSHAQAFDLRPQGPALEALRERLGLLGLRKVRLAGELTPTGSRDWRLSATLGATVQQPCVVTLAPVTTRLDLPVERQYLAAWAEPAGGEVEMDPDDGREALPETLDLGALLEEELLLALPLYPRAGDAAFEEPEPPEPEARTHPFAGLAALRNGGESGGDGDGSE